MESTGPDQKEIVISRPLEATANFEGNYTEILLERVKHSTIKKQIVDLLLQKEQDRLHYFQTETFVTSELSTPRYPFVEDSRGVVMLSKALNFVPRTREKIEQDIDDSIAGAENVTQISFSSEEPDIDCIPLDFSFSSDNTKPSIRKKSIIEAHEKGHVIRPYGGNFFRRYFSQAFDQSHVVYTEQDFENENRILRKRGPLTFEEAREKMFVYLFSGFEIAERMSQLKGYFGMHGDEQFTKEHLHYARQHYISDTGMDNRISHFFQAITSETEDAFIELINSSGI